MRPTATVTVRTGRVHWRDVTALVRRIDAPPGRCTLTLDAARVRARKGLETGAQRATTRWRVTWAHTAAGVVEGDTSRAEWRGDALVITLANVETRAA